MAIGIDLGFLALELAGLCAATDRVRAEVGTYARPAIAGTLAVSGVLNALAFGAQRKACSSLSGSCARSGNPGADLLPVAGGVLARGASLTTQTPGAPKGCRGFLFRLS